MILMVFLWYLLLIGLSLELIVHGGVVGAAVVFAAVLTLITRRG